MKQPRKNGRYSHSPRNLFTWRILVLVATIIFCLVAGSYSGEDRTYVVEKKAYLTPVIVENPQDESIETNIRHYFPKSHKTMIAIAYAESGANMKAQGWNCYYSNGVATTTPIKGGSKACNVKDRHLAYSTDCFALQKNYKGKVCPKGVTVDQHLKEVSELSRVQGLNAWTVYKTGEYKKYLAQQ